MSNDDAADEFAIIRAYFAPLTTKATGAFSLLDDAAAFPSNPGFDTIVTTDAIVAGVHFLEDETPDNIAAKLCGSNLSDLASMGAKPLGFTLACAWPKGTALEDIQSFAEGLRYWVEQFDFPLLGGDTVTTQGPAVFSLTAVGEAAAGKCLRRNGAKVGDKVFVTGTIGDGALGLMAAKGQLESISDTDISFLADRYRRPQPRITAGLGLIGQASACIDISDGLVQDAHHIARTSNVSIRLDLGAVPLSDAARAATKHTPDLLQTVLSGGDDYELLFCAEHMPENIDIPVTQIGSVIEGPAAVTVIDRDGQQVSMTNEGYNHFR